MVARIKAEAAQHSTVLQTFSYLTDAVGARPTGSPAHKKAAGRGWELQKFSLELTSPRYFPMTGYPLAWTPSTKGVLTGAPIYVADKTEAEITALGDRLRGAVVLASPEQTVFTLHDREQPADTDRLVRIGGPEPPAERQAQSVMPPNQLNALLQKVGAGAILRPDPSCTGR
jgi:hypothetical protein